MNPPVADTHADIRFEITFRGYKPDGSLASAIEADDIKGTATAPQKPLTLVEEFVALTLYKTTDTVTTLQAVFDKADDVGQKDKGFKIENILKNASINPANKFGNGQSVPDQAGAS